MSGGTQKSVGLIPPATLTFNTGAGEKFSVPGNAKFDIRVTAGSDAYHYICHFG